jgi:hypothetical protein
MVPPAGSACPSGQAIAAELDRLGASAALAALGSPEVMVEGTKMRVVLRDRDGSIMGTREVAAPEACHERASVAAVFIAAWVGAWSTEPLPNLSHPKPGVATPAATIADRPRAGVTGRAVPASPPPATPPTPLPASAPSPPPSSPPNVPKPVMPTQPRRVPAAEVAGLAFGTHDGNAGAFGAGVLAAYRLGKTLAVAALLESTGTREAALGAGWAVHRTSRLGLGASFLRQWGHVFTDAGIFPELTMLTVDGRKLVNARSVTTWGASVDLRLRLGFAVGHVAPFLFAGGSGALRAQHLTLDGSPQNTTLSRWNASAGAGLAFLFGGTK